MDDAVPPIREPGPEPARSTGGPGARLSNPGGTCLEGPICDTLEHQAADGSWQPLFTDRACPTPAISGYLPPGRSDVEALIVPAGSPTGSYRFTYSLSYFLPDGSQHPLTASFTIPPAGSTGPAL